MKALDLKEIAEEIASTKTTEEMDVLRAYYTFKDWYTSDVSLLFMEHIMRLLNGIVPEPVSEVSEVKRFTGFKNFDDPQKPELHEHKFVGFKNYADELS